MESIEFICVGSSSTGNAYIFKKHNECVLVECGFEWKTLLRKLTEHNVFLEQIKAVIITHEHSDHSASISYFVNLGVPCFVPNSEKLRKVCCDKNNVHYINENDKFEITHWLKVLCFPTTHDVISYGFAFLDTENNQSILFINDTKLFEFKYSNVMFDVIFIECNHIRKQLEAIMQQALDNGDAGKVFKFKRQSAYHLSLLSCKKFLKSLNLNKTKIIFLMHLSKECSQPDLMRAEIEETFKIKTLVCNKDGGMQ